MKKLPKAKVATTARVSAPTPALSKRVTGLMTFLESKPFATVHPMPRAKPGAARFVIYKVMGKMFAILTLRGVENVILKCDPNLAQMLRQQYKGVGHRSHLDRRFWISVELGADVPAAEIKRLVGHSYALVCATLTRKQQAAL